MKLTRALSSAILALLTKSSSARIAEVRHLTGTNCQGDTTYTVAEVQSSSACLVILFDSVFDLTSFINVHKGGAARIQALCQSDGTAAFQGQHGAAGTLVCSVGSVRVGVIGGGTADPCSSTYDASNPTVNLSKTVALGDDDCDGSDGSSDDGDGGFSFFGLPCFPGEATVQVKDQGTVAMQDVKIGDAILVDNEKYEPVYSFGHKDSQAWVSYLEIATLSSTLQISKEHLLFVQGRGAVPASQVTQGDHVYLGKNKKELVKSIEKVVRKGAYAPFTPSGTILVNDIKASNYIALQQDSANLQIAGFSTGLSFHSLSHAYQLPHRVWCTTLANCKHETYTADGISTWAAGPYKLALWFLDHPSAAVMAVLAVPLLAYLSVLTMASNPLVWVAAATVIVMTYRRFRSSKL